MYEMIIKIQLTQKRLIKKTREVVSLQQELQEKDQKYAALDRVLARMPGIELVEELSFLRRSVRSKNHTMKVRRATILSPHNEILYLKSCD